MIGNRVNAACARVGLVSVGHHTYWGQFEGLQDAMRRKSAALAEKLRREGVEVLDFGLADESVSGWRAAEKIRSADVDLLFVGMVTYATSSTFAPLVRNLDVPIVLAALQPLKAMSYDKATTYTQLCNDDFCSVPEFTGVALRMGKRVPEVILGTIDDDPIADRELTRWCAIGKAMGGLRRARLGHLGHVLEAMYDMHTDPAALTAAFGCHVVQCEPDEILRHYRNPDPASLAEKESQILDFFATPDPVSDPVTTRLTDEDLQTAARTAVALERFVAEKRLDGLAYYYEAEPGSEMRTLMTNLIVGNSLLTGAGFPMCGEFDIKTCVAMFLMDRLGMGGSFAEFHPVDFERDTVLVGHDGPHHIGIAQGKPALRSLKKYHGKLGSGASVEFSLKTGPITMLSIGVGPAGRFRFVIAEGESVPGPIPPTGNTNTHGKFRPDVRTFLKRWAAAGPTHHFALGIGHEAETLAAIARWLNLDCEVIR